jgi:hypothetical protein
MRFIYTSKGMSKKFGVRVIYRKYGNYIFYTLLRSFPRADASNFLQGEPILNAALAAATALSTSACNNQLKAEEQNKDM